MLDDFSQSVKRKVWEDDRGTRLLTVTGLLSAGKYEISSYKKDNGDVMLYCENIEEE